MKVRSNRERRRAMTLIEMIVALVLASVLMAALLQIVVTVSQESAILRAQRIDAVAANRLAERVGDDLINARSMVFNDNAITLAGFTSPDYVVGVIRYEVTTSARQRVLVRTTGDRREICWLGFGTFIIEPFDESENDSSSFDVTGDLPEIASRIRIAAVNDRGQVLFDEVVRHHAN